MRKIGLILVGLIAFSLPSVTFAQTWRSIPPTADGKISGMTVVSVDAQKTATAKPATNHRLRATASSHVINFSWTAFTSTIQGIGVNIYCGPTSGGETNTPVNQTPLATTAGAFQQTGVAGGQTLFCEANSVVGSGTSQVKGAPSNEVQVIVPLSPADLPVPGGFAGSAI